jgi:hypothetical protein
MFSTGRLAARSVLAASLAGLAALTAAPAIAAAGPAAAARPAATGSYKTWAAAQKAAGFRLKVPKKLYGLTRTNPILVGKCQVTGKTGKRDVYAEWSAKKQSLSADQNNSGGPCSNFGAAKPLGTRKVWGKTAHLYGYCGVPGEPSCAQKNVSLVLTWKDGHDYYVTFARDEWRSTLVGFSRSLARR